MLNHTHAGVAIARELSVNFTGGLGTPYTDDEIPAYAEGLGRQVVTAADKVERAAKDIQQAAGRGHADNADEIRELLVGAVDAFGALDDAAHWLRVMAGEWTEVPADPAPEWLLAHHALQELAQQACGWAREVFGEVSTQHPDATRQRAAALVRYADELEECTARAGRCVK